ncbi:carbohydrate ABC transporter permease [Georgenia sp. H159]|uniref:carbohydrate ABC transporter permease n=1 Tax=Georgenia sp. H159 TaxID=3076115 RepID=UPI002D765C97|nr:carbohydrate ABC transporter permease [Georgenia sp. H159]
MSETRTTKLGVVVRYVLLVVAGLIALFPIVWAASAAIRPRSDTFSNISPMSWRTFFPTEFTLQNFRDLFASGPWDRYFFNTVGVALVTTVLSVIVCSLAAYALARVNIRGSKYIFAFVLSMAILPFEVIAFPLYLVVRELGLLDTYAALVLPFIGNAFIIFLLRQFFTDVPKAYEEAARLDGAGPIRIYVTVFLPLTWPAHVTAALLSFQESWDQFLWPLIATSSEEVRVLQLGISTFISNETTQWGALFAAVSMTMTPPILLFLFLQRYYIRGLSTTGLK